MNTSTPTGKTGAAPCGCAGTAAAGACSCAGAGCGSCTSGAIARPNFFAGQLLTEDDLGALVDYTVGKNRLHNRHFLGDGVVCGLQVQCNPCGGGKLVVKPGYALDCCGNDLLLECAVELDAIAMVRELRRSQSGGQDCGDPCPERKPNGELRRPGDSQPPRRYCLYLRYAEEPAEPVAPYATDEPCAGAACEFTRIREGVRFELRCGDEMAPPDGFVQRFTACLHDLTQAEAVVAALRKLATGAGDVEDVRVAREGLLDLLDNKPQFADCHLRADVAAVALPAPGADVQPAGRQLLLAAVRLLRECLCNALLPPCAPATDCAVLLACIELKDCDVISICNLERKFVLTGPNLRYWLPLNLFGDLLERVCCSEVKPGRVATQDPAPQPGVAAAAMAAAPRDSDRLMGMLFEHLRAAFGMSERDAGQMGGIALDMARIFKAGGFDDMLPARALRQFENFSIRDAAAGELTRSAVFQRDREQLAAANGKALDELKSQNQELREQLSAITQRLSKLEEPHAPTGAGGPARKPGK